MAIKQLLSAVVTTGASTAYDWPGGLGNFSATSLGLAGAVRLQHTPDGTNWFAVPIPDSTGIVAHSTGAGTLQFRLPGPTRVRALITAASTAGISAWLS